MDQSDRFDDFTGQRVGRKNTLAFSSLPAKNDELFTRGERLKAVNLETAHGILMEVHGNIDRSIHDKIVKKLKRCHHGD